MGLLKEEMRRLGSLVLRAADATAVPAGRALAVDRTLFSRFITVAIETHPRIELRREELVALPDAELAILATGPLTSAPLAEALRALVGEDSLYFYDAISPIVYADSIDGSVAFRASRWEDGEGDYWNLPLDAAQYDAFVAALLAAESVPLHPFETALYFEGCLPIEEMARRGPETLRYGPLKPVGLVDPRSGRRPHAVVQLRHEDKRGVAPQPGRLPDEAPEGRAGAHPARAARARRGGVRALRLRAPQHVPERAATASRRASSCARGRASTWPDRSPASRATSRAQRSASWPA